MASTQPQILHEAEVHRQHVRLKIPIQVEMDGVRYRVDDWSMGGFGVEAELTSRQTGEKFPARLSFPFDGFDMALHLECQVVYLMDNPKRFGCRFTTLTQEQLGLFRYLVDAYLSGEVVTLGDVLHIRPRDSRAGSGPVYDPFAEREPRFGRIRRLLGYLVLLLLGLGLVWFLLQGPGAAFVRGGNEPVAARVTAPNFTLRAPRQGTTQRLAVGQRVTAGEPVAEIVTPDAGGALLLSPCDCFVYGWTGPEGQFRAAGEPVVTLVDAQAPLLVEARVPLARAEGLRPGDPVTIAFIGRDTSVSGVVAGIGVDPGLAPDPLGTVTAIVTVQPDRPLAYEDLGNVVRLSFDG